MTEFSSVFRKKNKLMIATMVIYCLISVALLAALIVGTVGSYSIQLVVFIAFTSLMTLRATYFVFEKVRVDSEKGVVTLKIRRKRFDITDIKSIKKIRKGQIRLITKDDKQFPISIDDEDEFARLVQNINQSITIEDIV